MGELVTVSEIESPQSLALEDVEPRFDVEVIRDVRIPSGNEGVTLSADLYLPIDAGVVPALVTVLPYRKDGPAGIGGAATMRWFAARGYACLLADFRGTGASDGEQRPPFDPGEADDGVATVEWAAEQAWCNGNVGMWGGSYGAIMAMRTAIRRPRHLRAIIPIMGALDLGSDFVHPAGSRGCITALASWSMGTLLNQLLPPLENYGSADQQRRWHNRLHNTEPWMLDLFRHGPGDPVWSSRTVDASAITVPTLCVAGWRDLFCDATIRAYESINAPKKLLAGPWMHTPPDVSPFDPVDYCMLAYRWWEHWLNGIDNGIMVEPDVLLFEQGNRRQWRELPSWPTSGPELTFRSTPDLTLQLDGDAAGLAFGAGQAEIVAEYEPDPTVGPLSGLWGFPTTGFGLPVDQHDDDVRSLTSTSEPLPDDLVVSGRPIVTVDIALGSTVERLVVRLTDVDPQGRSTLITLGVLSSTVLAGAQEVALAATCYRVLAGHRLRIAVSDADFPRLWPTESREPPSQVLRLTGMALSVPTLADTDGRPVVLPAPDPNDLDPDGLAVREQPRWEISRDRINDGVEVTVGSDVAVWTPNREHLLEIDNAITVKVRRDSPATARVRGAATGTAHMGSGEVIVARVELYMTRTSMMVSAQVDIDGTTTFSNRWSQCG